MGLSSGTKLGPYEILSPLGAGGMGEVYRARDPRLERDVAIKILPTNLSSDPNLRQRLEREARAISKLSHPHICTVHDIGSQDGRNFLVMELLQGETLEQRLMKGPLPADQTLRYAAQLADALAKAHKLGITHRDLKPSNIMLTKVGAKLMDFGLAKQSATVTLAAVENEMTIAEEAKLTSEGTLVGTFQYMAPEQLEGKEVDSRTDIFALGEVIYEMATGKTAFSGKSRASLIAAILTDDPPPITQLQPLAPPALERVIRKCVAKDPDERWQSAGDLASELNWISEAGSQAGTMVPPGILGKKRTRAIWIAAEVALVLLAALLAWQAGGRAHSTTPTPVHLTITLPAGMGLVNNSTEPLAITPDGSAIVYAAAGDDGKTQLYLRKLDSFESTAIAGTEGVDGQFFSPSGEWLAFLADGKVKKVLLQGGSPVVLADEATLFGGSWGDDDTIYYVKSITSGIYAVPAGGGQSRQVTHTGTTADDRFHLWPKVLPGNTGIIFTVWTGRSFNDARIEALSFKTGTRRVLVEGGSDGRYLSNGYLAYVRNGSLFVVGFDPERMEVKGASVPAVEGVMMGASNGDADFAVSEQGTLVFQPGTLTSFQRNLLWMDRNGKASNITGDTKPYSSPALSPDGKRIALTLEGSSFDVWVYDLERGTLTKVSFGADDYRPQWSPDGRMIAYDSSKSGAQQVYVKHGVVQGDEIMVTSGPENKEFLGWTADGRELVFARLNKDSGWDIYAASVEGDHKVRPLVVGPFNQLGAHVSPDGKWLAYVSDESGQPEVFVQAMSDPSTRAQISSEGGITPRWSRSGNELFFRSKNRVLSVKFGSGRAFNPSKPVVLFEDKREWAGYDVAADGRFVVARPAENRSTGTQINVVLNWFEEMKRGQRK
jgi:Tol biopolymer transport system component